MKRSIFAIIPAAGSGSRMQADKAKQYLLLGSKTVLAHTIAPFLADHRIEKVILAVNFHDPYFDPKTFSNPKIQLVQGGNSRAESVLNALRVIDQENAWALVHDAARPCLREAELSKLLEIDDPSGAILAIPAVDTIKRTLNGVQIAKTENRNELWQAQTPQFFPAKILENAIAQGLANGAEITDEASAMELAGFSPNLVLGRRDNLKITLPEDLALAEFYLMRNKL